MSNVQGMDALIRRMKAMGQTQPVMRALQVSTIHNAQKNVAPHRKTGNLQRNIVPGPLTRDTAVVEVRAPYAAALEKGARPHIIKPKNAKVLAWGGKRRLTGRLAAGSEATNFAAIVHHPGNKPYPYLVPGAKQAIKEAGLDKVVKAWNDAA